MERLGREIRWFGWDKEKKVWLGHHQLISVHIFISIS